MKHTCPGIVIANQTYDHLKQSKFGPKNTSLLGF